MTADGNRDADEDEDGNQDAGAGGDEDDSGNDASRQHVAPGGDAYVAGRDLYVNVHQGAATTPAAATAALGRPLAECNPYKLEVHRAIDAPGAPGELPLYVRRAHDDQVDQAVRAAAGGQSGLVVLVGGSSTGKTRCCWEAVRAGLPTSWRLFHPLSPSYSDALGRALGSIGGRTVVWLNDMQNFALDSPAGAPMVAGLRELLDDPACAPVLVVGTLWNQNWNALSSQPEPGTPDPLKQLRELLNGGTVVFIPPMFGPADLARARTLAERDPRLRQALAQAQRGEVTQFLAGAPDLLKRYHTAPPNARALIDAALGARRLGHAPAIPLALLAAAVPGYLHDHEARALADDAGWLDRAVEYATRRPYDASAALTEVDADGPGRRYRLADYLEQSLPAADLPAALLDALAAQAGLTDVTALGERVEQRGYYRYALALYRAAESRGETEAALRLAWLYEKMGQSAEALAASGRAVLGEGNSGAFETYGRQLAETGRNEEALAAYQRAVKLGSLYAANQMVALVRRTRTPEEAISWLLLLADRGHSYALKGLMELYEQTGQTDQAVATAKRLVKVSEFDAHWLVGLLDRTGRLQAELPWLQRFADTHRYAWAVKDAVLRALKANSETAALEWQRADAVRAGNYWKVAELIEQTSGAYEAVEWLRGGPKPNSRGNLEALGHFLQRAGEADEAMTVLTRAAQAGSTRGAVQAARMLAEVGRSDEAIDWLESCVAGTVSRRLSRGEIRCELAYLLARADRSDEALAVLMRAAVKDKSREAVDHAVRLLAARGDIEEALALPAKTRAADPARAFGQVCRELLRQGTFDEAITVARRAHTAGLRLTMLDLNFAAASSNRGTDETIDLLLALAGAGVAYAREDAARLLRQHGRAAEAERLERFGIEPGGTIADLPPTA